MFHLTFVLTWMNSMTARRSTTWLSTKGQVILPADLLRKLGWQAGQVLEVEGRCSRRRRCSYKPKLEPRAGFLGRRPMARQVVLNEERFVQTRTFSVILLATD
jgi:bifunctional DNA-binding transcriptional regulator/antitoxin component of YhaV-PrlF toxin-antitoxin module